MSDPIPKEHGATKTPFRLKRSLVYRSARFLYKFATDTQYRSVALIRLKKPPNLFQPFIDTWPDRYPLLFGFARQTLGADAEARILSFGCSTGEEVFTLRRYLPNAVIKGIDINHRVIAICKAHLDRSPDTRIIFEVANSTREEKAGTYDAIFCLAVLRHGDLGAFRADHSDDVIRFADFESMVDDFSRCLKIGGLLFMAHSNFRFCDTAVSDSFEVAHRMLSPTADPSTPIFDRNNRRLDGAAYGELAFRKIRGRDPG